MAKHTATVTVIMTVPFDGNPAEELLRLRTLGKDLWTHPLTELRAMGAIIDEIQADLVTAGGDIWTRVEA